MSRKQRYTLSFVSLLFFIISGLTWVSEAKFTHIIIPTIVNRIKQTQVVVPQGYAKQTILDKSGKVNKAVFSPSGQIRHVLIDLIRNEKSAIFVEAFILSEQAIVGELIKASKRKVKVEIVADRENAFLSYSGLKKLAAEKVPVFLYNPSNQTAIMHNKVMIFDRNIDGKSILVNGSCNFTKKGCTINAENAIFSEDDALIADFKAQFAALKKQSVPYTHLARIVS
jgi:phosphatidylserine/phosphatidylglycerophosphate/cardiolipin synthase-like enzyme